MVLFCLSGGRSGDGRERILRGGERIREKAEDWRGPLFFVVCNGLLAQPVGGKELDVRNVNGWPYISAHNS